MSTVEKVDKISKKQSAEKGDKMIRRASSRIASRSSSVSEDGETSPYFPIFHFSQKAKNKRKRAISTISNGSGSSVKIIEKEDEDKQSGDDDKVKVPPTAARIFDTTDDDEGSSGRKKVKRSKRSKLDEVNSQESVIEIPVVKSEESRGDESSEGSSSQTRKKKRSKKSKLDEIQEVNESEVTTTVEDVEDEEPSSRKTRKKRSKQSKLDEVSSQESVIEIPVEKSEEPRGDEGSEESGSQTRKKKSKKSKLDEIPEVNELEVTTTVENVVDDESSSRRTRKRSKQLKLDELNSQESVIEIPVGKSEEPEVSEDLSSQTKKKKRSKRSKLAELNSQEVIPEMEESEGTEADVTITAVDICEESLNELKEDRVTYDLSAVPSMDLVSNLNTLHGGMSCFKQLLNESEGSDNWNRSNGSSLFLQSQVEGGDQDESTQQNCPSSLAIESALFQGQAQFQELVKRLKTSKQKPAESKGCKNKKSKNQKQNDDGTLGTDEEDFHDVNVFDLKTKGQLMRSLFSDYDEKVRLCDIHSERIRIASDARLLRHFNRIKKDLMGVFSGTKPSVRRDLFVTMNSADRKKLERLTVADPFSNFQSMEISEEMQKFLFPVEMKFNQENYVDFIKFVLLPEALIRVYSSMNKISFEQSENEMKWGPRYDGPIDPPTALPST